MKEFIEYIARQLVDQPVRQFDLLEHCADIGDDCPWFERASTRLSQ